MNTIEIVAVLALAAYAVYRQTRVSEVKDGGRFTLAIVYTVVGIVVGGFALPHTTTTAALLAASIALSVVVGLARGYLTRVWTTDGRVLQQGTALTVGLFLALVAAKFGMGTYEYLHGIREAGGFGEVMMMIAVMIAVQVEIIRHRALALSRREASPARPGEELVTA
jgi:hypothetical protein